MSRVQVRVDLDDCPPARRA